MGDRQDLEAQIRRVREGDPAGFEAIVRAFEWPVRTWIVAHCPPGGDADDVAQRVFIETKTAAHEIRSGIAMRRKRRTQPRRWLNLKISSAGANISRMISKGRKLRPEGLLNTESAKKT